MGKLKCNGPMSLPPHHPHLKLVTEPALGSLESMLGKEVGQKRDRGGGHDKSPRVGEEE